jgi:hypothetical protein
MLSHSPADVYTEETGSTVTPHADPPTPNIQLTYRSFYQQINTQSHTMIVGVERSFPSGFLKRGVCKGGGGRGGEGQKVQYKFFCKELAKKCLGLLYSHH